MDLDRVCNALPTPFVKRTNSPLFLHGTIKPVTSTLAYLKLTVQIEMS